MCIFTDFLGDNLLAPGYELFIRENGVPGMGFGLAVSIITMSYIVGRCFSSAVMGPISDHTGRWNAILICELLTAVGFLMQALSWSFWSLVGFRFFTGFVGGTRVVIIVYITDWMSDRNMLTFWMSFIPIVSSVSSFAGPFLGGMVAQADESAPLNPAYVGLTLNAASFFLVLFCMRKSPKDAGLRLCASKRNETASVAESKPSSIAGPLVEWRAVCLWFLLCGLSSAGTQGWSLLLVTIQKELGLSSIVLGSISGWCGLMIITGQLVVLPFLFHRLKFSEGAVVVFGFVLAPFIIILGFVTNIWATIAIGSLFSLGVPLTMTMGFAVRGGGHFELSLIRLRIISPRISK
ncbi:Tetracycline resistance protein, class B, putative [Perkinsus marinus ATCC 50983]|uniref:Tetracycline resistance protein, class B, putative n=1 Tax=Perkinsus marinus (strain ATCC 50983 / TXsc) TaxID=423536 RepID=C5LDK0_PERM5|nr:Tetracycline resistance protein, class B, putative [Perkinsus marinus ATCC 50983]EER05193.1 Tetracycline resistance protein, class B, putative [Perkinsus marinus ATCC 50983]|eukprot:XP_002773377.1 Tetracycline resistance protein, class B, putative [Perkinsus marinus ATCC 50983]